MRIKKRFIAAGCAALVVFFITGSFLQYKSRFRSMTPVDTAGTACGVVALRNDFVNSFIIPADSGTLIAIDAGRSTSAIQMQMAAVGLSPSDVRVLFLTHTDYDHVGGIGAFPGAKVYIFEKEEMMLRESQSRGPFMKNRLDVPFTTLKDGETVNVGGRTVRIMALPGHTTGHAAYIIDDRYLFCGDAVKIENGRASVFIPAFNMDTPLLKRNITRLNALKGIETVFTAHFGISTRPEYLFEGLK